MKQSISWPEPSEVLPHDTWCDECRSGDESHGAWSRGMTVSIRVEDTLIVHRRMKDFITACGKTFDEMSLANFEVKR